MPCRWPPGARTWRPRRQSGSSGPPAVRTQHGPTGVACGVRSGRRVVRGQPEVQNAPRAIRGTVAGRATVNSRNETTSETIHLFPLRGETNGGRDHAANGEWQGRRPAHAADCQFRHPLRAANFLAGWRDCRGSGSVDFEPDVRQAKGWFGPDVAGWRELRFVDGHDRSAVAVRLPVRHRATGRHAIEPRRAPRSLTP